jgi:tetratricopeptide (TPR) repeat protein
MKSIIFILFLISTLEGRDRCPWGCGESQMDERLQKIGYSLWDCIEQTKFLDYEYRDGIDNLNADCLEIVFYGQPSYRIDWHVIRFFPSHKNPSYCCPFAKEEYLSFAFQRAFYLKKDSFSCRWHPDPFLDNWRHFYPWSRCKQCRKGIKAEFSFDEWVEVDQYPQMIELFSLLENDINSVFNFRLSVLKLGIIETKTLLDTKTGALAQASNEYDLNLLQKELQELQKKVAELSAELDQVNNQLAAKLDIVEQSREKIDAIYADIYTSCEQKHGIFHGIYYEALRKFQSGNIEEALEKIIELISKAKEMGMETSIDKEVYLKKGVIESELGRYYQAIDTLTQHLGKFLYDREAYFERAVAYFETGQFDQAFEDFIKSRQQSTPVNAWNPLTFDYASSLTEGVLSGSAEGITNFIPSTLSSATHICHGIWTFIKNPKVASQELVDASRACVQFVKAHSSAEIAQVLVPELKELVNDWDILPDSERGRLTGYIIGKYRIDVFAVGASSKFFNVYRNLKRANNVLAFELAAFNKENKALILAEASRNLELKKGQIKHFDIKKVLNREKKQSHIFDPKHNLDKLGDDFSVMQKVTQEVFRADQLGLIPHSGPFEITVVIDGYHTVVRGAIVEGELNYSTIFIPK